MFKVDVYPLSLSGYSSQVYAGLFDLAHQKIIDLHFISRPLVQIEERGWQKPYNNNIVYLELSKGNIGPIKICYDLLDGPEMISLNGLALCDFYFKRSYSQEYIASNVDHWQSDHPEYRSKIKPYGLNTPAQSKHEFANLKRALIYCNANKIQYKEPYRALKINARALAKEFISFRTEKINFETLPEVPAEPLVMFQTRLFVPRVPQYKEEDDHLNELRIDILRSLKSELGDNFIGGLMPDEKSKRLYPELLTKEEFSRRGYLNLVRRCKIVIMTRGKRQSTGWRFPEYMAASRCIVSQDLAYELPSPLIDQEHYITFQTASECVSACKTLLDDESAADNMRRASFDYYQKNIYPPNLILNTINEAWESFQ